MYIIMQTDSCCDGIIAIIVQYSSAQVAPELAGACQPLPAHWEHLSYHHLAHAVSSTGSRILPTRSINHPPVRRSCCLDYAMPAFIWRCCEQKIVPNGFAFIARPFQHFPSFNEGSGWGWLSETMEVSARLALCICTAYFSSLSLPSILLCESMNGLKIQAKNMYCTKPAVHNAEHWPVMLLPCR